MANYRQQGNSDETNLEQSMMIDEDLSSTFNRSSLPSTSSTFTRETNSNEQAIKEDVKDVFYCASYFDLDDILSQTIRLSVKFQRTVPKLGFLDPSFNNQQNVQTDNDDSQDQQTTILKGTKLELPLWLVKELNGDNAVTVTLPKGYNQVYREILEADANCVNLQKLGPQYYLIGKHLTSMNLPESEDLALSMLDTFTQRFQRLVNFALSGGSTSGTNVTSSSPLMECSSSQCSVSKIDSMLKSNSQNRHSGNKTGSASIQDETLNELNQFISRLDQWERHLLGVGQKIARQIKCWQNRDLVLVRANEMVVNLKKRKILFEQNS